MLSDFWPHGAVSQAYGVFNDDAGFSNRGTFVIDRSGIIRFAEMKQPGEARDQRLWTDALAALGPHRSAEAQAAFAQDYAEVSGRRPTRVACAARARSSVVELWFYTPAVGGSIPSAPTSVCAGQARYRRSNWVRRANPRCAKSVPACSHTRSIRRWLLP